MTIITRYELDLELGASDCEACGTSWDFISVASYGKVGDPGFNFYAYRSLHCCYHDGPDGETARDLARWLYEMSLEYPDHAEEIYEYQALIGF